MLAGVGVHGEDGMRVGDLDEWDVMLCLVCVRRFVYQLVGHPCCVIIA